LGQYDSSEFIDGSKGSETGIREGSSNPRRTGRLLLKQRGAGWFESFWEMLAKTDPNPLKGNMFFKVLAEWEGFEPSVRLFNRTTV
jgi:hypothetical protein